MVHGQMLHYNLKAGVGNMENAPIFFTGGLKSTKTGLSRETAQLYGRRMDGTDCGYTAQLCEYKEFVS